VLHGPKICTLRKIRYNQAGKSLFSPFPLYIHQLVSQEL
jgi:hypothetical protein